MHRGWLLAEPRLAYFSALVSTCDARPKRAQHIYLVFHHILACSRLWSDLLSICTPPNAHACFASPYLLSAPQHLYLRLPLKPNQTCTPRLDCHGPASSPLTSTWGFHVADAAHRGITMPSVCPTPFNISNAYPIPAPPHIGDST